MTDPFMVKLLKRDETYIEDLIIEALS